MKLDVKVKTTVSDTITGEVYNGVAETNWDSDFTVVREDGGRRAFGFYDNDTTVEILE